MFCEKEPKWNQLAVIKTMKSHCPNDAHSIRLSCYLRYNFLDQLVVPNPGRDFACDEARDIGYSCKKFNLRRHLEGGLNVFRMRSTGGEPGNICLHEPLNGG